MKLSDEMFLDMVQLLQYLGLACFLSPSEDDYPEKFKLLVPWFLGRYPESLECLPTAMPEGQVLVLFHWPTHSSLLYTKQDNFASGFSIITIYFTYFTHALPFHS